MPGTVTVEQLVALLDRQGHEPCPGVRIVREVEIQRVGAFRQTVTVFAPERTSGAAMPAVVMFHGGGFSGGNPVGVGMLAKYLALSLRVTTLSAGYRLGTPQAPSFPFAVQDAADACRWMVQQAPHWGLDPTRVVIGGESAGCCIAALTLLTSEHPDLAGGGRIAGVLPRFRGLVAQWGPLDFVARWFDRGQNPGAETSLLGINYPDNPTLYHRASPIAHVRPGVPPAIFVYGRQDPVVHPRQGQLGESAWKAAGSAAELVLLDNIGHAVVGDNRAQRLEFCRRIADFVAPLLGGITGR